MAATQTTIPIRPDDGTAFFTPRQLAARRKFHRSTLHARLSRLTHVVGATVELIDLIRADDARHPHHLDDGRAEHLREDLATLRGVLRIWHGVIDSPFAAADPDPELIDAITR